jgi:hypothetical protein
MRMLHVLQRELEKSAAEDGYHGSCGSNATE